MAQRMSNRRKKGVKRRKIFRLLSEKSRNLLVQVFPDVIEIEGKIFDQDHDTEDNKGHQKRIAQDKQHIIEKLKSRRIITRVPP